MSLRRSARLAAKREREKSRLVWLEKDLGVFPIWMTNVWILRVFGWEGLTLPFVVLFYDENPEPVTIRHETIHYLQYKELYFVGFMFLYVLHIVLAFVYFAVKHLSFSKGLDYSYHANPFEQEAHYYETESNYLHHRKRFAWLQFVSTSFIEQ